MTPVAPVLLALFCAIFGTTSELTDLNIIADELYEEATIRSNPKLIYLHNHIHNMRHFDTKREKREIGDDPCEYFRYQEGKKELTHPKNDLSDSTYLKNTTCITTIEVDQGSVIELTFVELFELEGSMPECEHDYIEIRDGKFGYSTPMYKFCGKSFPPTITSVTPHMWLKFHSDETIEYGGFKIEIGFPTKPSRKIHESCYITAPVTFGAGAIGSNSAETKKCREESPGPLDIQWKIETKPNTRIFLNITEYKLARPNECKQNIIQVFGSEPNFDHILQSFCGSVATSVTSLTETKEKGPTNIMYVRMFTTDRSSNFSADFTGFRTLGPNEACDETKHGTEFHCLDSTCIDIQLRCNKIANCRMKADEDPEICETRTDNLMKEPETRNILIILSLILTGICSVLIFKCGRKIYLDQKQIRENLAKSCEDRLDKLSDAAFMLDPGLLTREELRASLDRDNHNNEMVKQHRNKRRSSSIDSDLLDLNEDWSDNQLIPREEVRTEREAPDVPKPKRDLSRREETLRSKKSSEDEERKIRDVAVEVPDALEAACQTRESLFQADAVPSSGSNSTPNGRKHSNATVVQPPTLANTSQITIELVSQPQASSQTHERPMSSETTRSAPDVIIVSKPIF